MDNKASVPKVSVGLPVYNGEGTLESALLSLVLQTHENLEIIISDNASTDATQAICESFADKYKIIKYIRQEKNIGAAANFKFVLDQAQADYFFWAAADDIRSHDYAALNAKFLMDNLQYVASTSPNCYEHEDPVEANLITFALHGDAMDRFTMLLDNVWVSHGIFYAMAKTDVLKKYPHYHRTYLASDWSLDFFLASHGKINRCKSGLLLIGSRGASTNPSIWKLGRRPVLSWFFPLFDMSRFVFGLTGGFNVADRSHVFLKLLILNLGAARSQVIAELYQWYRANLRPLVRRGDYQ